MRPGFHSEMITKMTNELDVMVCKTRLPGDARLLGWAFTRRTREGDTMDHMTAKSFLDKLSVAFYNSTD